MSSLRNVTKRKTHKERAQPSARRHLGLLEKKGDYKLRADNYHKKRDRIKTLTRKASEKNADEFYFGMTNTVAGAKKGPEGSDSTHKATSALKASDLRYVATRKVEDDRRVDRLRANLHGVDGGADANEHTYFGDGGRAADDAAHAALTRPAPKPDKAGRLARKRVKRAYRGLDDALAAQQQSAALLERLEAEKHVLRAKGRKRKVAGGEDGKAAVFKWKKQRQK